jgi:hypothetical protein
MVVDSKMDFLERKCFHFPHNRPEFCVRLLGDMSQRSELHQACEAADFVVEPVIRPVLIEWSVVCECILRDFAL